MYSQIKQERPANAS